MKHIRTFGAVAILLLAMAAPSKSMAQSPWGDEFQRWLAGHPNANRSLQRDPYDVYDPDWRAQHPEVQEYLRSNPGAWNRMRSNIYYSESLNQYLNSNRELKARLAANPELIYDRRFRDEHPNLRQFLQDHPEAWRNIGRGPRVGGPGRGWGDYDDSHQWRDADWWHEHDRAWMYRHHPEWAENHPEWRDADGDFDDSHVWHDRDWWADHHRDWVERHHPDWFRHEQQEAWKHQEHAEHEAWKNQEHAEHEAYKNEEHAEHEAYKDREHAEHEAYKAGEKQEKHDPGHGGPGHGPGDHDNH